MPGPWRRIRHLPPVQGRLYNAYSKWLRHDNTSDHADGTDRHLGNSPHTRYFAESPGPRINLNLRHTGETSTGTVNATRLRFILSRDPFQQALRANSALNSRGQYTFRESSTPTVHRVLAPNCRSCREPRWGLPEFLTTFRNRRKNPTYFFRWHNPVAVSRYRQHGDSDATGRRHLQIRRVPDKPSGAANTFPEYHFPTILKNSALALAGLL